MRTANRGGISAAGKKVDGKKASQRSKGVFNVSLVARSCGLNGPTNMLSSGRGTDNHELEVTARENAE
jgi:hypothetical protein